MQNVLIVCADKELRKDISKVLARELNFLYVDVDDILDFELLNNQDVTLTEAKDVLQKLERKCFDRVMGFNNCVVTVSRDLFLSNNNFKLMNDYIKVFVLLSKAYFVARTKTEDFHKLEQELVLFDKINKLIEINCNIIIEKEIKSIEEIGEEIIKKIKK